MRFEIRAGGAFLILLGLLGLSCVVFALGLVAGYQMARQTLPENTQEASVYPAPSLSPTAQASPAAAQAMNARASAVAIPATESERLAAGKPASPVNAAKPAAPPASMAESKPAAAESAVRQALATASPAPLAEAKPPAPHVAEPGVRAPARAAAGSEAERTAPAAPSTEATIRHAAALRMASESTHAPEPERHPRRPYNIQINAAMDRANADNMASRLRKLGYHAFLVPTNISGQTWWQVRVGPYGSREEAAQAEQRMREQYRATYAGH